MTGVQTCALPIFDYSLAEVAQIVEYNEAKVLSCYVTCMPDSNKVEITLKVNTARIEPILDTFIRYRYVIKWMTATT